MTTGDRDIPTPLVTGEGVPSEGKTEDEGEAHNAALSVCPAKTLFNPPLAFNPPPNEEEPKKKHIESHLTSS